MTFNPEEFNYIKTRLNNNIMLDFSATGATGWDFTWQMQAGGYYSVVIPSGAKYYITRHSHGAGLLLSQESELSTSPLPSPNSGDDVVMPASAPDDLIYLVEDRNYVLPIKDGATKIYVRNESADGAKIHISFRKGRDM